MGMLGTGVTYKASKEHGGDDLTIVFSFTKEKEDD